jgi:hypothetical protein
VNLHLVAFCNSLPDIVQQLLVVFRAVECAAFNLKRND